MAEPNAVLQEALAKGAVYVGVRLKCPRYSCDWREDFGNAVVVNEFGVEKPMPRYCGKCGLLTEVEEIVEVIGG